MTAIVKKDACIGCGACAAIEENVFILTDEGLAEAKKGEIKEEYKESVREAAESCPTSAIEIKE